MIGPIPPTSPAEPGRPSATPPAGEVRPGGVAPVGGAAVGGVAAGAAGRTPTRAAAPPPAPAPALAVDLLVVETRQVARLLRLLGRPIGPHVGPATPVVRSASGIVGPLVDAGPHAVARAALAGDHTGANAKAFAIEARPGRVDLVVVQADWREGLPAGPRGAAALAEALREGLWVTATDGRPAVEADVVARGEHLLVDLRAAAAGAPPPRVAPVLDNAGFALLARPGLTEDPTAPGAAADPAVDLVPLGAEVVVGAAGGLRGGTAPLPPGVEQASQVAVGALAAVAAIVTGLALGWANLRDLALVVGVVLAGAAGAVLAWRPLVGWWRTLGRVQPAGRPRPPRPGRPVAKVQLRPHKRRP